MCMFLKIFFENIEDNELCEAFEFNYQFLKISIKIL